MSKIHILPETLSNKIAAGEVVERPASVVKELVENSIDAGAAKITVEIDNGGRSLIRISDDGQGMSRDDALLSLERYATSKIADEQSLFAIQTLGFRGEALPSIASVSAFSLITRPRDADTGTEINVNGGKIADVKEIGAPPGTMIEVRRLFYNTPARRKFLKAVNTEMGHITDTVAAFALCRPDIHFKLIHNGKTVKHWPSAADPRQRTADILGKETRGHLQAVSHTGDGITISGWISAPHITRSTSQKIYLFVNGRIIRDRGLQYALFEGYRGRLVKGAFPLAAIFITLPFDRVDVNVHPTKSEVRFVDQKKLYDTLKAAVAATWAGAVAPPWETAGISETVYTEASSSASGTPEQVAEAIPRYSGKQQGLFPEKGLPLPQPISSVENKPSGEYDRPAVSVFIKQDVAIKDGPDTTAPHVAGTPAEGFFSGLTVVGQLRDTYILCESASELVVIDQHAAHERISFERLKQRKQSRRPASQALLIPETVEVSYQEAAELEKMLNAFAAVGLEVEPFGQNSFVIKAVPELLAEVAVGPMVREIAEKLTASGFAPEMETRIDACLHIMACHGSIRANQRLSEKEMTALLVQLDACENPWHCPHGRPTSVNWNLRELEKSFKRIV